MIQESEIGYYPCRYEDIKRRQDNINKVIELVSTMPSSVALNTEGKTECEIFREKIDLGEAIDILNQSIERLKEHAHNYGVKLDPMGALINIDDLLEKAPNGIKRRVNYLL